MAQESRQDYYKLWTVDDLERLRLLRSSYNGKRSGKNCRFHSYLASQMNRTVEGIAHGTAILHGHKPRSSELGYTRRLHRAAVLPRNLTDPEITYLAAMFEAEGSILRWKNRTLWRVSFIVNVDHALLDYVQSLVPFASRGMTGDTNDPRRQLCYAIYTSSRRGVLWACMVMRPHIRSYKLARVDEAIRELTPIVGADLARDIF